MTEQILSKRSLIVDRSTYDGKVVVFVSWHLISIYESI